MVKKNSILDLPVASLTVVFFLFMMTITGGVPRLINYAELDTSLLRELAIMGSSILLSFVLAFVIKKVRKKH